MFTIENQNGTVLEADESTAASPVRVAGKSGKSREKHRKAQPYSAAPPLSYETPVADAKPVLAMFCFEDATSVVGQFASQLATALAKRNLAVHLFVRQGFELTDVTVHALGASEPGELVNQVQEFALRASNEFLGLFRAATAPITLFGCEWSSMPAMTILQGSKNLNILWSVHSLERQRGDMTADLCKRIEEIELAGLRAAKSILIHDQATADIAKTLAPECADRIVNERQVFPIAQFMSQMDAGQVKARYQVGPIDPTILFVGDLSEGYGPDILVKSMPAILKNHPQARLVVVGDGSLYWPLRVYARYLLIEHAVRLVGSIQGQAVYDLVQAADIIALPSRANTPWWPFLAGWAAHRPVVATHDAASGLLTNEQDSILCYPNENSLVWGIERILYDPAFGRSLAAAGHDKLQERFGWKNVAAQVESLLGVAAAKAS